MNMDKKSLLIGALIIFIVLVAYLGPGANENQNNIAKQTTKPTSTTTAENTKATSVPTTEPPKSTMIPIDTKILSKFQGEWTEDKYSDFIDIDVIISGIDVNFIHYEYDKPGIVTDILTFHFEKNKDGKLVVCNSASQPRYVISLKKKKLVCRDISDKSDKRIYEHVSDNTILPEIKVDPKVGMSEGEVLNSTWGSPERRNTTQTLYGTREQWVYEDGYIYLTNGFVTSIQTTK